VLRQAVTSSYLPQLSEKLLTNFSDIMQTSVTLNASKGCGDELNHRKSSRFFMIVKEYPKVGYHTCCPSDIGRKALRPR
jgi:hypothetical protein